MALKTKLLLLTEKLCESFMKVADITWLVTSSLARGDSRSKQVLKGGCEMKVELTRQALIEL